MAILIDQVASQLPRFVGALSEYTKGFWLGKNFGKGSVQELVPLTQDSSIKITVAKWYTPLGHSISESGLEPNIKISITDEDLESGRDPQEAAAVDYLLKR